uniref:Cytochrome P450 n=1 Tax=Panagrellus redivivus TaxID=6233 RepID=A0A7E4V8E1_PANRE
MWLAVLIVGFITGITVYLYHVLQATTYWKRRGIPSVPSSNIFTNQLDETTSYDHPICFQLHKWTKEFGPIYGIFSGTVPELVISDPAMVHEMLNKKFECFHGRRSTPILRVIENNKLSHLFIVKGARWKRLRTISAPIFSTGNLRRIVPIVEDSSTKMMEFINLEHEKGKPFNIHPFFYEYTMDVICRIATGQKGSKQFENPNVAMVTEVFKNIGSTPFERLSFMVPSMIYPIFPMFMVYSLLTQSAFYAVINGIRQAVEDRIKLKESGNYKTQDLPDFIDFFLDSIDENVTDGAFIKNNAKVVKRVTTEEIVGQCFAFLLAGFDTTANTLGTTSWYLAKHPNFQDRVYDEIQEVCNTPEVTYEQLGQLKHIDVTMKEVLRLAPIATGAISRECMESTTLGNIPIEKGTNVWIDLVTLNQNKEIWGDDASEFRPERFFDVTTEMQNANVNFGAGPRICIGMKKYRIVATDETEAKLEMCGRVVQHPKSITVKLELR